MTCYWYTNFEGSSCRSEQINYLANYFNHHGHLRSQLGDLADHLLHASSYFITFNRNAIVYGNLSSRMLRFRGVK